MTWKTCLDARDAGECARQIQEFLEAEPPKVTTYLGLAQGIESFAADLPEKELNLYSSFTLEPIEPYLKVWAFVRGWRLKPRYVPYVQWQGELSSSEGQEGVLLWNANEVLPYGGYLQGVDQAQAWVDLHRGLLDAHKGTLMVSSFGAWGETPETFAGGKSRRQWIRDVEASLIEGHRVFPLADLVEEFGSRNFFDPVKADLTQCSVSPRGLAALAQRLTRYLDNHWRPRKKVLALDADSTLWGGIVGEDGLGGIQLGHEGVGLGFRRWQEFLKEMSSLGVLLVLNSRNNLEDVREVFEKHEGMVLKWEDLANARVNWGDKAQNLVEMAEELRLGVDSFVFIDDSPTECARVREALPEVTVVQAVGAPQSWARKVLERAPLESLTLTQEDRGRAESYQTEAKRREISGATDFIQQLGLELTIERATEAELPRLVQLAGKTNQFNTTTLRYTEAELRERLGSVFLLSLKDRFGDYGKMGMVVLRGSVVESFLMSCRVLGRSVEEAVLASLVHAKGAVSLEFGATPKNKPVLEFLQRVGGVEKEGVWEVGQVDLPGIKIHGGWS